MEQYDKNVTVILEFLIAEKFSASVISLHRLCYKALRKHLTEEKILYSPDAAYRWIDDNKACWTYRQHTGWKHCVDQLEDVIRSKYSSFDAIKKARLEKEKPVVESFLSWLD